MDNFLRVSFSPFAVEEAARRPAMIAALFILIELKRQYCKRFLKKLICVPISVHAVVKVEKVYDSGFEKFEFFSLWEFFTDNDRGIFFSIVL